MDQKTSKNIFKKKLQEQTLDVIFLPGKSVKIQTLFFCPLSLNHSSNHEPQGPKGPDRAGVPFEFSQAQAQPCSIRNLQATHGTPGRAPAFQKQPFLGLQTHPVFCEIPPILLVQPSMLVEASGLVEPKKNLAATQGLQPLTPAGENGCCELVRRIWFENGVPKACV